MINKNLIHIFYIAATGKRRTQILLTALGPLFFLSLLALPVIASLWTDRYLVLPVLLPPPLNILFSIPLLTGGLLLTSWSVLYFLKVRGTPVPFNPPPVLVDTGPYALSRNPMLSGVFLLLFGLGALLNSFSLILIYTPLFILLMVWEVRTVEEQELAKRLGEPYLYYKEKVPMFFPRIRKSRK